MPSVHCGVVSIQAVGVGPDTVVAGPSSLNQQSPFILRQTVDALFLVGVRRLLLGAGAAVLPTGNAPSFLGLSCASDRLCR